MDIAFEWISMLFIIGTYVLFENQEKCDKLTMKISLYNCIKITAVWNLFVILLSMIFLMIQLLYYSFNLIKNYTWIFEIATIFIKYKNISLLIIYSFVLLIVFITLDSPFIYLLIIFIFTTLKLIIEADSDYNPILLALITLLQFYILLVIPCIKVKFFKWSK
jgi:hypothetical protein